MIRNTFVPCSILYLFVTAFQLGGNNTVAQDTKQDAIPDALKPWKGWVLWEQKEIDSPRPYDKPDERISVWPATLQLQCDQKKAAWKLHVHCFSETWVSLPGSNETWPLQVVANGSSLPILLKDGHPSVKLQPGEHDLEGKFHWESMPQSILIPSSLGILELTVEGVPVATPHWDRDNQLWLERKQRVDETDQLSLQVHRLLEDGSPIWLRSQLEFKVSGRSREVDLGTILPEGWQLSSVASPFPVAIDDSGNAKVQVRSGAWRIQVDAFRNRDLDSLHYAASSKPAKERELIGIRLQPEFRTAELRNALPMDVMKTTYPKEWRSYPLFEWQTNQSLAWAEKTRGPGLQNLSKLQVQRRIWIDEAGDGFTYFDSLRGTLRASMRLDSAADHEPGVLRVHGERQWITKNPQGVGAGVELSTHQPQVEAVGKGTNRSEFSASGWQADVEQLSIEFQLPPGWRMFALLGADQVSGDWLTAWSLLDLFLLLVFSVAVLRIWGWRAGLIAFLAFGLSYHEVGSPRFTWLFLLIPLAILRVVQQGKIVQALRVWRTLAVGILLLNLLPFMAVQIQNALYPQLERMGVPYSQRAMFDWLRATYNASASIADLAMEDRLSTNPNPGINSPNSSAMAPALIPGAGTQTGMAKPEWSGSTVQCQWDGPVARGQTIRPVLISSTWTRVLTVARLALLACLLSQLLRGRPKAWRAPSIPTSPILVAFVLIAICFTPSRAVAQMPDAATLDKLRTRLLAPSDAFPYAADVPTMSLQLANDRLTIQAECHAAETVAIPLPGGLSVWAPVRVLLDSQQAIVCRRSDGLLWVLMPQGVHQIEVHGEVRDATELGISFSLAPRKLRVVAPEWTIEGMPSSNESIKQLFLVRKQQLSENLATYDQRNVRPSVRIERRLELGVAWKVHTRVERLSAAGRAISVQIPLIKNENVITPGVVPIDESVPVTLSADQIVTSWESELQPLQELTLTASEGASASEKWVLVTSPLVNVQAEGLQPIFELHAKELVPIWYPWPSESVKLRFREPVAVEGRTVTIQRANHAVQVGTRQRVHKLDFLVESSLGGNFPMVLPETAKVTGISSGKSALPIQRVGSNYEIPLNPGLQKLSIEWTEDEELSGIVKVSDVSLPIEAANVSTSVSIPDSRWILWANGPERGPAVRFWIVLILSLGVAFALSCLPLSPLRWWEWVLLAIGLTQVHVVASLFVVAWLLILAWRGKMQPESLGVGTFNLLQLLIVAMTIVSLGILIVVVGIGLLGSPDMFILGNGSYGNLLNWFEPVSGKSLSTPSVVSISVWYYRFLMLLWALWLANSLIRWLKDGWQSFTHQASWR